MKLATITNGIFDITAGTYFVRVTAIDSNIVTGSNYTLTIAQPAPAGAFSNPVAIRLFEDEALQSIVDSLTNTKAPDAKLLYISECVSDKYDAGTPMYYQSSRVSVTI